MNLKVGDNIIISTGIDENTNLPIMKIVKIKNIRPVYEVCKPESPNHTFDITEFAVKGIIK